MTGNEDPVTDRRENGYGSGAGSGWITGALLSIAVTLLCLLTCEFTLRQWFPIGSIIQRDNRYLYKHRPGSSKLTVPPLGSDPVLIKINSEGRRGDTLSKDHRFRVAVYGDSFIFSDNSPLKETFAYRLERLLGEKLAMPVQVINAGVSGYGPDQESRVMEDDLPSLRPDLIILAIFSGNDFGDLLRDKLYRLDQDNRLIEGSPHLSRELEKDFEKAKNQSALQLVRRVKSSWSALRSSSIAARLRSMARGRSTSPSTADNSVLPFSSSQKFMERALWLNREEYRNYVLQRDDAVYNLEVDGYDEDISVHPDDESSRYKILFMERMMERIQGLADTRSIPLIFLFIPTAIDIGKWDITVDPQMYPEYRPSALTDVLERIAKTHRFSYVNLFDPFLNHRAANLFFRSEYGHWNAAGQQLAADQMAQYIVQQRKTALQR